MPTNDYSASDSLRVAAKVLRPDDPNNPRSPEFAAAAAAAANQAARQAEAARATAAPSKPSAPPQLASATPAHQTVPIKPASRVARPTYLDEHSVRAGICPKSPQASTPLTRTPFC